MARKKMSKFPNKARAAAKAGVLDLPINRLKKDPGVPNLQLSQKQLEKIQNRKTQKMLGHTTRTMAGLAIDGQQQPEHEDEDATISAYLDLSSRAANDPTMAAHAHQFKKVLETADVILQILDARDPLGCRSRIVEEEVLRSGGDKKIILVINKTDLVPAENVLAWLKYLRHEFPAIPFKSSTQQQRANLSASAKAGSKGASHLLHLLKSIRPAHQSITVGVIGPPNVGKSSLINSIKRERVCTVGAKPGETKVLKEVAVERGIKVIDSPGIVWGDAEEGGAFRNVWSLEGLEDPVMVVEGIVSRVPQETLAQMYGTPPFKDATEFLIMVALVRGKLGKGGKPDLNAAALNIVHDWNVGKIPFYTTPPEIHPSMVARESVPNDSSAMTTDDVQSSREATYANTSIVTQWGKAFDLDGLLASADADVLAEGGEEDAMMADDGGFVPDPDQHIPTEMDHDAEEPEMQEPAPVNSIAAQLSRFANHSETPASHPKARKERRPPKQPKERTQRLAPKGVDESVLLADSNPLSRKRLKEEAKRRKKEARRVDMGEDIGMADN